MANDDDDQVINPLSTPFQNPTADRKRTILCAAEKIMSSKGFKEATISEIASLAGVKDSIIYRYFKGKEDILFSIAEERLKEGLALLDRDLKGLNDPHSKLRKLMWGNLWYHHENSSYSRIFYMECLSSTKYYNSPYYLPLEKYMSRLTDILEQGIRVKKFRDDLSVALMEDIIFGVMSMTVISFHELGEIKSPGFDFEDNAFLVEAIILSKAETEKCISDKTSTILEAAEKVFAKKGFNKAKMTDIAKTAGVADGTIYEYFENKDSLLFSIPKRRFQHYMNDLSDIFYPESAIGKLRKLIKYHFTTLLGDLHFLRVFVYNLYLYKGFYRSEAFEVYRNYYKLFEAAVEEGKACGVFRSEVNSRVFRNMLIGTSCQMGMRWLREKKTSELELTKDVNQVTDLLVEAVLANPTKEDSKAPG